MKTAHKMILSTVVTAVLVGAMLLVPVPWGGTNDTPVCCDIPAETTYGVPFAALSKLTGGLSPAAQYSFDAGNFSADAAIVFMAVSVMVWLIAERRAPRLAAAKKRRP